MTEKFVRFPVGFTVNQQQLQQPEIHKENRDQHSGGTDWILREVTAKVRGLRGVELQGGVGSTVQLAGHHQLQLRHSENKVYISVGQ